MKSLRRNAIAYRGLEGATEALIYGVILFAPWAFGSTNAWAIVILNWAGLLIGAIWAAKIIIRRVSSIERHAWVSPASGASDSVSFVRNWPVVGLAALNVIILAFCFVSGLNAKSEFQYAPLSPNVYSTRIEHENFISWLPYSYDATATWWVFIEYLGLSLVFWATRDWLLGKTRNEIQKSLDDGASVVNSQFLTERMRRLLWVVCVNGGLLALEGILQKLSGSNKSLWISMPATLETAAEQFGPWAYRSNGAQYINLIWPVCLGFWLGLHKAEKKRGSIGGKVGQGASVLLVPCLVIMASSPFISSSRGGALIGLMELVLSFGIILYANRRMGWKLALAPAAIMAAILISAGLLGSKDLVKRFEELKVNETGGRAPIYRNAHKMAEDTPVFGLGPGSFMTLYQFYRDNITDDWAAMAHNDYLETRITFGWIGFALILALVPALASHVWRGRGIPCDWQFIAMLWISLAGCMAHAKFDFPFQIHSILGMFLTVCCLQSCLVRQR